jgi:putative transcriptional regulator
MKFLSKYLTGKPLIVGKRAGSEFLKAGVVYKRHGISSISTTTLYEYFVEGTPPFVYSAPGGLYVTLNGATLRKKRMEKNLSLGNLASEIGVSRRSIKRYEEGMSTTIEKALKLEEILDTLLVSPLNLLASEEPEPKMEIDLSNLPSLERQILDLLKDLGFDVIPTLHSPFDALSQDSSSSTTILTGVDRYSKAMEKRAELLSSISAVTRTESVFIVDGCPDKEQIGDTVLIEKKELEKLDTSGELVDLIKCRKNA